MKEMFDEVARYSMKEIVNEWFEKFDEVELVRFSIEIFGK